MRCRQDQVTYDLFEDQWLWLFGAEPLAEEMPVWTEDDIFELYERVLQVSIQALFDARCSRETFKDIRSWITTRQHLNPFSFEKTCEVLGLDSDVIRDSILFRLERAVQKIH